MGRHGSDPRITTSASINAQRRAGYNPVRIN
jgi:hypothetical protein